MSKVFKKYLITDAMLSIGIFAFTVSLFMVSQYKTLVHQRKDLSSKQLDYLVYDSLKEFRFALIFDKEVDVSKDNIKFKTTRYIKNKENWDKVSIEIEAEKNNDRISKELIINPSGGILNSFDIHLNIFNKNNKKVLSDNNFAMTILRE